MAITGTATITSLGTGFNGCYRELRFAGALTLTHSASLKLPGSANITTAAGDNFGFRCTGSGVWELVSRASDSSKASLSSAVFTGGVQALALSSENGNILGLGATTTLTATSGTIRLRPNGASDATGQVSIDATTSTFSGNIAGVNADFSGDIELLNTGAVGVPVLYCSTATGGNMWIRPGGRDVTTGQVFISKAGLVSGVNFTATSDARKKENATPHEANPQLADLLQLFAYTWIDSGEPGTSVMAQDVQKIAPQYVHEDDEGFLSIDKAGIALECVLGLAARVRALEAK